MSQITVTCFVRMEIVVGAGAVGEEENLRCTVTLPFLPRQGDFLSVLKGDDYREVGDVYWDAKDGFHLYFKDGSCVRELLKEYKTLGWKKDPRA